MARELRAQMHLRRCGALTAKPYLQEALELCSKPHLRRRSRAGDVARYSPGDHSHVMFYSCVHALRTTSGHFSKVRTAVKRCNDQTSGPAPTRSRLVARLANGNALSQGVGVGPSFPGTCQTALALVRDPLESRFGLVSGLNRAEME